MHLQVRSSTKASPADVEKFLRRLKEGGVNISGAGGTNPEFGGEFALALEDDQRDAAKKALDRPPKYEYRILEYGVDPGLTLRSLVNEVGALHAVVAEVAAENRKSGRKIRDVLIGVQGEDGKTPVQIYSE
jgi:hypothetical protein